MQPYWNPAVYGIFLSFFNFTDHFITCFYAFTAAFCAFFAMLHVVGFTLFSTPVANLCANVTILLDVRAVPLHSSYAESANLNTFPAAVRAIIITGFIHHVAQAFLAIGNAFQAGVYAVLVIHGYGFFLVQGIR